MASWLIRAGRDGERESWCLTSGYAGGGFYEVSDLTMATTRDAIRDAVTGAFPGAKAGKTANFAGQLHALRNRIVVGDLVVLPLKSTGQVEFTEPDPTEVRHQVPLDMRVVRTKSARPNRQLRR